MLTDRLESCMLLPSTSTSYHATKAPQVASDMLLLQARALHVMNVPQATASDIYLEGT